MTKIEIKNLSILFGPEKMRAKRMLVAGKSKQDILKETGCTVAVRNANLKIEEGELFVIMGLSGSGKSTLLRCINRLNIYTCILSSHSWTRTKYTAVNSRML